MQEGLEGLWTRITSDDVFVKAHRLESVRETLTLAYPIVERLQQQAELLKPKIDDWRAMVDCVLIDPDYDGQVFRIGLSDVPERKTDLVSGRYEIPAEQCGKTIAVKLIDMLGEEVVVTRECP